MMRKPTDTHPQGSVEQLYQRISYVLADARSRAYRAVNFAMVQAYWEIGRIIVEEEQQGKAKADYGEYLLKDLSRHLTKDFGKGFDPSNPRYMRLFYLSFEIVNAVSSQSTPDQIRDAVRHTSLPSPKGHALRDELPVVRPELTWTHYRLLLKVERPEVRQFFLDECIAANWSTRQLDRQICSFFYERLLASHNKDVVRNEITTLEPGQTPLDIIKDPFVLEFLNMRENRDFLEKELEQALIDKLHDFLLELGRGFAFVGRQTCSTCQQKRNCRPSLPVKNRPSRCKSALPEAVMGSETPFHTLGNTSLLNLHKVAFLCSHKFPTAGKYVTFLSPNLRITL